LKKNKLQQKEKEIKRMREKLYIKKKHKCWLKDKIENQQNSNKSVNDQNEKSKE
jgi:hypothetical protein